MVPVPTPGGGLSLALTYEMGHWGIGGFATAAGSTAGATELTDISVDTALLWGFGALLNYTGERTGLAPIFGVGLGFGGTRALLRDTLDIHRSNGAMITARAGAILPSDYFFTLNSNIPLFSAVSDSGSEDSTFAMSIIFEIGYRFGG